jgi:hypothetical protein
VLRGVPDATVGRWRDIVRVSACWDRIFLNDGFGCLVGLCGW